MICKRRVSVRNAIYLRMRLTPWKIRMPCWRGNVRLCSTILNSRTNQLCFSWSPGLKLSSQRKKRWWSSKNVLLRLSRSLKELEFVSTKKETSFKKWKLTWLVRSSKFKSLRRSWKRNVDQIHLFTSSWGKEMDWLKQTACFSKRGMIWPKSWICTGVTWILQLLRQSQSKLKKRFWPKSKKPRSQLLRSINKPRRNNNWGFKS